MRLMHPRVKIETPAELLVNGLKVIERAGRTCYQSEWKIGPDTAPGFTAMVLGKGHESVIEHVGMMVRFITDRGVTHEMVRHRLAAYSQESTRYVDYAGDKTDGHCQFIIPPWCDLEPGEYGLNEVAFWRGEDPCTRSWLTAMHASQESYAFLRKSGWAAQQARDVLPNSTKTEIVMTANLREWRHVFKLRTSPKAHPQMRQIMAPLLMTLKPVLAPLFDDIPDPQDVQRPAEVRW